MDPTTQTTRLISSMLWDKGPITYDVCFALVRKVAEKRKANEDKNARKRHARENEITSKKQDACILASMPTTRLTCAGDVHNLTVEQLGAILLSFNEKKPKGKAAMVEAVLGFLGLPSVAAPMHHPLLMLAQLPPVRRPFPCCRICPFLLFPWHSIYLDAPYPPDANC